MTGRSAGVARPDAELLERAMGYTLGSLQLVTPELMSSRTPCAGWDLRALLQHMDDSLLALDEAISLGRVGLGRPRRRAPAAGLGTTPSPDPVASLRDRGCRMVGLWTAAREPSAVSIADRALPSGVVAAAGALEIAVHGWDVAWACGQPRPIPSGLAGELLGLGRVLVDDADRPGLFAARVPLPPSTSPSDRLLAFTGRDPLT